MAVACGCAQRGGQLPLRPHSATDTRGLEGSVEGTKSRYGLLGGALCRLLGEPRTFGESMASAGFDLVHRNSLFARCQEDGLAYRTPTDRSDIARPRGRLLRVYPALRFEVPRPAIASR